MVRGPTLARHEQLKMSKRLRREDSDWELDVALRRSLVDMSHVVDADAVYANALLRDFGIVTVPVRGDGNCLFTSLEDACNQRAAVLRHELVQYIERNGMQYVEHIRRQYVYRRDWATLSDDALLAAYVRHMTKDGSYGGELELYVLLTRLFPAVGHALVFRVNRAGRTNVIRIGDPRVGCGVELAFTRDNHYDRVTRVADQVRCHVDMNVQVSPPAAYGHPPTSSGWVSSPKQHAMVQVSLRRWRLDLSERCLAGSLRRAGYAKSGPSQTEGARRSASS